VALIEYYTGTGNMWEKDVRLELILSSNVYFIYVDHLMVRSYFCHAETGHSLLLFDLRPHIKPS